MPLLASIAAGSAKGFGRGKTGTLWGSKFIGAVSRNGTNDLVFTITSTIGATNLWLLNSAESSSIQVLSSASSATYYLDGRDTTSRAFWNFCRANSKQALKIGPNSTSSYKEKSIWFDFEVGSQSWAHNDGTAADERSNRSTKTLRTLSSDGISSSSGIFVGIGAGGGGSGGTSSGGGGGSGKVSFKIVSSTITSYQLFPGDNSSTRKGWSSSSDGYRKAGDTLINVNGTLNVTAHGGMIGRHPANQRSDAAPVNSPISIGLEAYGGGGNQGSGQSGLVSATANDTSGTTRWSFYTAGSTQIGGTGYGAGGGGQSRDPYYGGTGSGGGGAGGWAMGTTSLPSGASGTSDNVGSGGQGTYGAAVALLILR